MDALKIATAGSVDDGKSTLIGRLLFETGALKADQVQHIKDKSARNGFDYLDFSLATDGLLTEREQGITIDVSHIYFSTAQRRFIIADSPGHVEYTRNMVTGASNAQMALILVDARKGITEQTRRHFCITRLLDIRSVLLCVNKMDLVNYDQAVFQRIVSEFSALADSFPGSEIRQHAIPLSALHGENVAHTSPLMPWYIGGTLLALLEKEPIASAPAATPADLQVQYVLRPRTKALHDYRAYLGRVNGGTLRKGDLVTVLPSGASTQIRKIEVYGKEVDTVQAGDNCSLLLAHEVDISRGDSIAVAHHALEAYSHLSAQVCWMADQPLRPGTRIWVQHGVRRIQARVSQIDSLLRPDTYAKQADPGELRLNDIGTLQLQLASPLYGQPYRESKASGAFILIDDQSFATAGLGMLL